MRWIVHIDGGSRGNPGPAGCGVVIHRVIESGSAGGAGGPAGVGNSRTEAVLEAGYFLERATNNVAEYTALLKALTVCVSHIDEPEPGEAIERIEIVADSELLVRQVQGRYKVKAPGLKPLYQEAMAMLQRLEAGGVAWSIQHTYREGNQRADALANAAMDRGDHVLAT